MIKNLKGIYPPLLTPFTNDDNVNEKELEKLARLNPDKGIDGFFIFQSTSFSKAVQFISPLSLNSVNSAENAFELLHTDASLRIV